MKARLLNDAGLFTKAALYARVSTGKQAEKDLSIPDQFRQMRAYCDNHELTMVREFSDAQTGTNLDRPGLQEMIAFVRANPEAVDVLLVHSFSRLARESYEFEGLRRQLEALGVMVISITQSVENSANGALMRKILTIMDEQYSIETAKHVARSLRENARQGFWNGGTPPFGYQAVEAGMRGQVVKKKLDIHPAEAEDVRLIFALYLNGDGKSGPLGVKKLAAYLNRHGISRRNGAKWTIGMVHRVLTDRVYVGEHIFGKSKPPRDQVIVDVPPIVKTVTFDRVQRRLRHNNPQMVSPRRSNSPILLSSVATCSKCGAGMILRTGKGGRYRYYACSAQVRKGKSVCSGQSIPMKDLDELVTSAIIDSVISRERCESLLATLLKRSEANDREFRDRSQALEREKCDADGVVSRLYRMIEVGIASLDDAEFVARFEKAKIERDIVVAKLKRLSEQRAARAAQAPNRVAEFTEFLINLIANGPVEFRKAYLKAFIKKVSVDSEKVEIFLHETGARTADCC